MRRKLLDQSKELSSPGSLVPQLRILTSNLRTLAINIAGCDMITSGLPAILHILAAKELITGYVPRWSSSLPYLSGFCFPHGPQRRWWFLGVLESYYSPPIMGCTRRSTSSALTMSSPYPEDHSRGLRFMSNEGKLLFSLAEAR